MANDTRSRADTRRRNSTQFEVDDLTLERVIGDKIEPQPNGCWVWTGGTAAGGYARHTTVGLVHRWIYELMVNPIPDGFHVHHECENKACVNPDHLRAMPPRDHLSHHAQRRLAC